MFEIRVVVFIRYKRLKYECSRLALSSSSFSSSWSSGADTSESRLLFSKISKTNHHHHWLSETKTKRGRTVVVIFVIYFFVVVVVGCWYIQKLSSLTEMEPPRFQNK